MNLHTLYALLFSTELAATAGEHVSVVHRGMLEPLCWSSALSRRKEPTRISCPDARIIGMKGLGCYALLEVRSCVFLCAPESDIYGGGCGAAVPGWLDLKAVEPLLLPVCVRDHVPERSPALCLLRIPWPEHHPVQQVPTLSQRFANLISSLS